jgi:GT2 family glycosyltransferase
MKDPKDMVIVGVPTLNRYDLLERLITSMETGTVRPDGYAIVDNGNRLRDQLTRRDWFADFKLHADFTPSSERRFVYLTSGSGFDQHKGEHAGNMGVAASWNHILKTFEWFPNVILSGDDIVVEPDTIEKMVRHAERSKSLFIIAKGASSWAFFLQKPELARKIGYYDEKFWPAYYEDNDYHRRMLLAGEDYELAEGAVVSHDISSTLNSLPPEEKKKFEAEIDKNSRYYGIKWGGPPGYERLTEPNPDAVNHR